MTKWEKPWAVISPTGYDLSETNLDSRRACHGHHTVMAALNTAMAAAAHVATSPHWISPDMLFLRFEVS
jgi:acyl-coenzyme A thioesterase PaaI-like protein